MKRFLCVALLCAVGCTSVPTAPSPTAPVAGKEHGLQVWVPNFFADLWEVADARIAMDYGFGAQFKLTDLARIGIFDYSEFSLIGVDKGIFKGEYAFPDLRAWNNNGSWDLSAKFGMGLGAEFALHTWEVVDFFSSLVCLGFWSFDDD